MKTILGLLELGEIIDKGGQVFGLEGSLVIRCCLFLCLLDTRGWSGFDVPILGQGLLHAEVLTARQRVREAARYFLL